jgi:hypothetical protein
MTEVEPWITSLLETITAPPLPPPPSSTPTTPSTPSPNTSSNIRMATIEDATRIFEMIVELAEYEKARHEVVATQDDITEMLFGGKDSPNGLPAAYCHVVVDKDADGNEAVVGMALW